MGLIMEFFQEIDIYQFPVIIAVSLACCAVFFTVKPRKQRGGITKLNDATVVKSDNGSDNEEITVDDDDEESEFPQVVAKFTRKSTIQMIEDSTSFYTNIKQRRSIRAFSDEDFPVEIVENLIKAAGTAPSGSNLQPWTFAIVRGGEIKRLIRDIIEREEETNYARRMGEKWVKDVSRLKVNWQKPYLETAPYIIVVLKKVYGWKKDGSRQEMYYNEISTSIAVGFLLVAIHVLFNNAGLATVTTTHLNAGPQIRKVLNRPVNEKVLVLLPVGYPVENATIPDISKKSLVDIMSIY